MAITRIGNLAEIQSAANSGSQSITVPADAEVMIVSVSGYSSANYFTSSPPTIGGSALTAIPGGDASSSYFQGAMFYKMLPATGTQTFAWDWAGTSAPSNGVIISYGFYKGIDNSSIRDSDGTQGASQPFTTKTLTAQSNDLIIAWGHLYWAQSTTFTWTNAVKIADFDAVSGYGSACGTWAEGSPSGNTTVTIGNNTGNDGGVSAIVLKPGVTSVDITIQNSSHTESAQQSGFSSPQIPGNNGLHGHIASQVDFSSPGIAGNNAVHNHTASQVDFSSPEVLGSNSVHSHAADNVNLTIGAIVDILIDNALHGTSSDDAAIVLNPTTIRGHIRRRHKRYLYRDIQEAIEKEEQQALEEKAAQIALEELEQEKRNRIKQDVVRQKLILSELQARAKKLQVYKEWIDRQEEVLKELIELQNKYLEEKLEDDNIEAMLMLL